MPRGYARYVLAVMVGINFLNYLDRYILPAVATKIQAEFHLTDGQVGLLGSAFLLVYAVATIPFGIWADRGVRKTVIGIGVTIWSLATLFTGLARSYAQLFAARAVMGIGEASYYPAGTALLGDYFKKEGRGRAMSVWASGTAVGIAVGFAGGGIVASILGWRAAFYMTAVPGLVFAVLAFGLREPLRGAAEARGPQIAKPASITWRTFAELLRIPTLRATIAAETALFFVLGGAAFWLPTYLQRRFALGTGTAGTLAGGVLVVGLLAGSLLGGTIADRLAVRRRTASNLPVGIAGFILGAVFVALALLMPSLVLFVPMFLLGAACLYLRPAHGSCHRGHGRPLDRAPSWGLVCALCHRKTVRRVAQPSTRPADPAAAAAPAGRGLRRAWPAARGGGRPRHGDAMGRRRDSNPVKQVVFPKSVCRSNQREDLGITLARDELP
ncbi:MAG: MFS transporter [Chloroflexi bacterium]|nr:MAG: MFS transporter [Chloroflexota bacterium]